MKYLILIAALASTQAYAWDCSVWTSNVPGMECYKPPVTPGDSNANTNANTQGQTQGQGQSQTATGGKATATATGGAASATGGSLTNSGNSTNTNTVSSQGGAGGAGGNSQQRQAQSATASNAGNNQSSYYSAPAQAPGVVLPNQVILGCGVAGSVGGSNVHGAIALGVGFTTDECYSFIDAQANMAVGDYQTACEILHHNNATLRYAKRGAKIADCALLTQKVVEVVKDECGADCEAGVRLRIEHAIAEYIDSHPTPVCPQPKPHHGHPVIFKPCPMPQVNVAPAPVIQPDHMDLDINVNAPPPR